MDAPDLSEEGFSSPTVARLAFTVSRMVRGSIRLLRENGRPLGLSLPQLFLLGALWDSGALAIGQWVEMVGVSPSAMTSLLDGLEEGGFVVREHAANDRRQVMIELTPRGRRLAGRLRREFRGRWNLYCAEIPSKELEAAAATLGKVADRMSSLPAPSRAARTSPAPRGAA